MSETVCACVDAHCTLWFHVQARYGGTCMHACTYVCMYVCLRVHLLL